MAIEWGPVIASGISAAAGVGTSVAQSNLNKKNRKWQEEQAAIQRQYSTDTLNSQNAWNMEMWNKENEYNAPLSQVERLREAGLNPLYYGLDGSSASALESASPLGYERAESNFQTNPIAAGIDSFVQAKGLENSTKLINAQVDKLKSETSGLDLDNEFKERTMNARVEGADLANSLTRNQIKEIDKKMDVMDEDIRLKIAQTDNEIEKKALIQAEKILAHAQAAEIVYLLPFRQNLLEAQTEAQKAAASASYMHALYEKGLIDGGYIDSLCKEASNRAEASEYDVQTSQQRARMTGHEADIEKFKSSVRNGTLFKTGSWWSRAGNDIFGALSALSEALGGSLVPLIGGFAVGKATGSKTNVNVSGATPDVVAKQTSALGN